MIEVGHSVITLDGVGTVISHGIGAISSHGRMFDSAMLMIRIVATGAVQWYQASDVTLADQAPHPSAVVLPFRR